MSFVVVRFFVVGGVESREEGPWPWDLLGPGLISNFPIYLSRNMGYLYLSYWLVAELNEYL